MNTKRILLVEDNPDDEQLTLRALRKNQIEAEVLVARDGLEALNILLGAGAHAHRRGDRPPALILLDLKLPRVDGLELLRRIRANQRTRLLPVVVMSSSREETDLMTSYGLGANSYIRKPVNFDEFTRVIGELAGYWLRLNEAPPLAT
jgi:two-component system response regulator